MKTIEVTSGIHVQLTTSDLWIYDNPPEGFRAAQKSNCNYFQVFATGQQQAFEGVGTYQAQDLDEKFFCGTVFSSQMAQLW